MTNQLEIERKFLVELPKSWEALASLFDNIVDVKRIEQFYLKPPPGQQSPRIRKTIEGLRGSTKIVYHINQKKSTKVKGVNKEKEEEITEKQYQSLLKDALSNKRKVSKIRYVFKYENQLFELDIFKDQLKGLAILEIELKDKDQKIKLPLFLKTRKEVTGDDKYSNFYLADKSNKLSIA